MFATLLGGLPAIARSAGEEVNDPVSIALEAQAQAGLDPLTGGRPPVAVDLSRDAIAEAQATASAWRSVADRSDRSVKQALIGPFTVARTGPDAASAEAIADRVRTVVDALAAAGCPLVEIHEPEAVRIGDDERARRAFRAAHVHVATDAPTHLTLALLGGSVDRAGSGTFLDPPYASYALDLVDGPDNWRVVADIPGDRGVVCGAVSLDAGSDDVPELLVWAAHYAASMAGRGLDRVGLGTAGGLDSLSWVDAVRKLERLGEAARIAALPRTGGLAAALDPRAVSLRGRALGRHVPRRRRGA